MSSNLRIAKKCLFCGKEFTAKQMRTRFCCSNCAHKYALKLKKTQESGIPKTPTSKVEKLDENARRISEIQSRPYISVAEASFLLGISQDTIRRQIIDGIIPAFNLGERLTRIDRAALERLFQKDMLNLAMAHRKEAAEPQKSEIPELEGHYSIADIVSKYGIAPSRVYAIINKYDLPKIKIGRYTFVPQTMADELFTEYKKLYENFEETLQNKSDSSPA